MRRFVLTCLHISLTPHIHDCDGTTCFPPCCRAPSPCQTSTLAMALPLAMWQPLTWTILRQWYPLVGWALTSTVACGYCAPTLQVNMIKFFVLRQWCSTCEQNAHTRFHHHP